MKENKNNTEKFNWEQSFDEQVIRQAYNTAPVEAIIRNASYYLRDRFSNEQLTKLNFLEMGCGTGPNLKWLAQKGINISGVDTSPIALALCRKNLEQSGLSEKIDKLVESSVVDIPFEDESIDGIFESCVFQHLKKEERHKAFSEVKRVLKPGGLFVGYLLDQGHSIFKEKHSQQQEDDPGTLLLEEGKSKIYLTNLGVCHFFTKEEIKESLSGFSKIDPCLTTYYLPSCEAEKRGYSEYMQSMWSVYAIK
jgi:ubiquinone/menaquinone biosynthesis C-methylase UbiE